MLYSIHYIRERVCDIKECVRAFHHHANGGALLLPVSRQQQMLLRENDGPLRHRCWYVLSTANYYTVTEKNNPERTSSLACSGLFFNWLCAHVVSAVEVAAWEAKMLNLTFEDGSYPTNILERFTHTHLNTKWHSSCSRQAIQWCYVLVL